MSEERWRWIKDYEGLYMVSDHGRVMGLPKKTYSGHIMKQQLGRNGYLSVHLCKDGKHKRMSVHRAVADAFIKNSRMCEQVNHKDGVKTNNKVSNLEWVTRSENQLHAYRELGRTKPTGGTPRPTKRKLSWEQVCDIRNSDESQSVLAKRYGVSQRVIWCIRKGLTYKEVA